MKSYFANVVRALCLGAVLAGSSAMAADLSVSTDGSTSMEKTIGSLGEAFMEKYDGASFTYNPTGSGSGIAAVSAGRTDIGLSSRALTSDEAKTLNADVLALDGIVVVVNPDNPVSNLTVQQIADLYTGKITSWKGVGGADAPVVLIGREAGSGTRDGFETVTNTKEQCKYRQELTATGDVITTVASNPNAIGYASLSALSSKVKAVQVNGVTATEETVQNGTYKLQRPFVLVTRKDEKLTEGARKFMEFADSDEARPIIAQSGAVPVKK